MFFSNFELTPRKGCNEVNCKEWKAVCRSTIKYPTNPSGSFDVIRRLSSDAEQLRVFSCTPNTYNGSRYRNLSAKDSSMQVFPQAQQVTLFIRQRAGSSQEIPMLGCDPGSTNGMTRLSSPLREHTNEPFNYRYRYRDGFWKWIRHGFCRVVTPWPLATRTRILLSLTSGRCT